MSDELLLELDEVDKHYGAFHALKRLTLSLPRGTSGLLGPNGAGKSTLIKILLGLLPFTGRVRVLGHDVRARPREVRAAVGYMPERDNYLPGMSAVDYCVYAAELSGLPPREAMSRSHAVLEFVGLGDKRYQRLDGYSTGQNQRVKLAQALVHDPELLLLDEPTNGLDPQGRDEMLALVGQLPSRNGCSVLVSSHLLPDVEYLCERAILLHEGEIQYSGTIAALRDAGGDDALEVRVRDGEEALEKSLRERGCTVEREGATLAVRLPAVEHGNTDLVFQAAEAAGVQVRHLAPRRLTLEAAFVRVVGEAKSRRPRDGEERP